MTPARPDDPERQLDDLLRADGADWLTEQIRDLARREQPNAPEDR